MFVLIKKILSKSIAAQLSMPFNFLMGIFTILASNLIFFFGIYLLAFSGTRNDPSMMESYILLTGIVTFSWGLVNFLGGGLSGLAYSIETGEIENYLAFPKNKILILALIKPDVFAVGDILQGLLTLIFVLFYFPVKTSILFLFALPIAILGYVSLLLLIGGFSFFFKRGSVVSSVAMQISSILAVFPSGHIFRGDFKVLKYISPALFAAHLPLDFVEMYSPIYGLVVYMFTVSFFFLSCFLFNRFSRQFNPTNLIQIK